MPKRVLLGLIGSNIMKSLSPALHANALKSAGMIGHYHLMDVKVLTEKNLPALFSSVKAVGFNGVNVTFPFKEAVIPLLDELSEDARQIGAVNTVTFDASGRTTGHNTDCSGFRRSFESVLSKSAAAGKTVVLAGAGGAGRAVAFALMQLGVSNLLIYDKDGGRATRLAENIAACFGPKVSAVDHLDERAVNADGLVNATPIGMEGFPGQVIPSGIIRPTHWVADVVYTPLETQFLSSARTVGATAMNGAGMCVYQAVEAFRLFTGVTPDAVEMEKTFHQALAERGHES